MKLFAKVASSHAVAACALALVACAAPAPPQLKPQLLWAGTYDAVDSVFVPFAGAPGGGLTGSNSLTNFRSTTTVGAKLGSHFGIKFTVPSASRMNEVSYSVVWTFPDPGLRDPDYGGRALKALRKRAVALAPEQFEGWVLNREWEVLPGQWIVQVFIDEQLVIQQAFEVQALGDETVPSGSAPAPNPSIEATAKSWPRYSTSSFLLPRGQLSSAPHVER